MPTLVLMVAMVAAVSLSETVLAQSPPRQANAALMRQYSWTSRMEVVDQGQVKDTRIDYHRNTRAHGARA